jgi:hypothetical protein
MRVWVRWGSVAVLGWGLGCGSVDSDAAGGAGGGAGAGGDSETCRVICNGCADREEADACNVDCQSRIDSVSSGLDLDSCPDELAAVGECLEAAGCFGQSCDPAFFAWFTCVGALSR